VVATWDFGVDDGVCGQFARSERACRAGACRNACPIASVCIGLHLARMLPRELVRLAGRRRSTLTHQLPRGSRGPLARAECGHRARLVSTLIEMEAWRET
jgi:hypothetical protein